MLSDKINRLPISRVDYPSINSFDEQNTVILVNKQGNILSFEHSRRISGAAINVERSERSTGLHGKPIAYDLKNVTEELEERRAELAALARAAEARAKEAEKWCEQAESRLEQELNQRMLAEQRLSELREGRLQQAAPIEAHARTAPLHVELAHEEMGAWLKEVEGRAKEVEVEIETLTFALTEAEQKRAKAETFAHAAGHKAREFESLYVEAGFKVTDLETRLNEALAQAREQAEARRLAEKTLLEVENNGGTIARVRSDAETAKIALAEANRKMAEAEAAARAAEERAYKIESLYAVAEASAHQATERYQTLEAELQREVKQRAWAEQKLKEFEDELSSYLELDWPKGEPDMALVGVARESGGPDEFVSRLQAQVEAERRARQEAEDARAALELKMREMERALRIAEENNRQIASLNLAQSADANQTYTVKKQKGFKRELRFIAHGTAIALLLVALCALIGAVYFQI